MPTTTFMCGGCESVSIFKNVFLTSSGQTPSRQLKEYSRRTDGGWSLAADLVPLYGVEEVQVRLVWYPTVNDQDLSINDCRKRQKAKHVLKQLEDFTTMNLHTVQKKRKKKLLHCGWQTVINYMLQPAECSPDFGHNKCRTMMYVVCHTLYFCMTSFVNPYLNSETVKNITLRYCCSYLTALWD